MYKHRRYVEKSSDFEKMVELVTRLNAMHIGDWSVGRMYAWKYGRWSKKSQDDLEFEKQAELFFDDLENLCGIVITENFGMDYYLLSEKDEEIIQNMILYLDENEVCEVDYSIILSADDVIQQKILIKNSYSCQAEADTTYIYPKDKVVLPHIAIPDSFTLSDQQNFKNMVAVEQQRFFSFNPDSEYDEVIDKAYRYARSNPILLPELNIVLLDNQNTPVSSCMGYWDKSNQLMEIEVVATKAGYENRGFAKLVISACICRGLDLGVKEVSISAWEEKTRKLYSSFGEPVIVNKVKYKR